VFVRTLISANGFLCRICWAGSAPGWPSRALFFFFLARGDFPGAMNSISAGHEEGTRSAKTPDCFCRTLRALARRSNVERPKFLERMEPKDSFAGRKNAGACARLLFSAPGPGACRSKQFFQNNQPRPCRTFLQKPIAGCSEAHFSEIFLSSAIGLPGKPGCRGYDHVGWVEKRSECPPSHPRYRVHRLILAEEHRRTRGGVRA